MDCLLKGLILVRARLESLCKGVKKDIASVEDNEELREMITVDYQVQYITCVNNIMRNLPFSSALDLSSQIMLILAQR